MADRRNQDKDEKSQIVKDLQYSSLGTLLRSVPRKPAPPVTPPMGFAIPAPETDILLDYSPSNLISSWLEFITHEIKYQNKSFGLKVRSSQNTENSESILLSSVDFDIEKVELSSIKDSQNKGSMKKNKNDLHEGRDTYTWDLEDIDEPYLDDLFCDEDDLFSEEEILSTFDEKFSQDSVIAEPFFDPTFHGIASLTDDVWPSRYL